MLTCIGTRASQRGGGEGDRGLERGRGDERDREGWWKEGLEGGRGVRGIERGVGRRG